MHPRIDCLTDGIGDVGQIDDRIVGGSTTSAFATDVGVTGWVSLTADPIDLRISATNRFTRFRIVSPPPSRRLGAWQMFGTSVDQEDTDPLLHLSLVGMKLIDTRMASPGRLLNHLFDPVLHGGNRTCGGSLGVLEGSDSTRDDSLRLGLCEQQTIGRIPLCAPDTFDCFAFGGRLHACGLRFRVGHDGQCAAVRALDGILHLVLSGLQLSKSTPGLFDQSLSGTEAFVGRFGSLDEAGPQLLQFIELTGSRLELGGPGGQPINDAVSLRQQSLERGTHLVSIVRYLPLRGAHSRI